MKPIPLDYVPPESKPRKERAYALEIQHALEVNDYIRHTLKEELIKRGYKEFELEGFVPIDRYGCQAIKKMGMANFEFWHHMIIHATRGKGSGKWSKINKYYEEGHVPFCQNFWYIANELGVPVTAISNRVLSLEKMGYIERIGEERIYEKYANGKSKVGRLTPVLSVGWWEDVFICDQNGTPTSEIRKQEYLYGPMRERAFSKKIVEQLSAEEILSGVGVEYWKR